MGKHYLTGPITDYLEQIKNLLQIKQNKSREFDTLSDREVEVLELIAKGNNNPDIADKLGISRATVENHRTKIREKLNIDNQADYVRLAMAFDLITM